MAFFLFMTAKIPKIVKKVYPKRIWDASEEGKAIYLTFDDGPIPEATPWVLEQLRSFGAKASFFCIGENIEKHPEIFRSLLSEGHTIGNHTYNHLNGWKTTSEEYLQNTLKAREVLAKNFPPGIPPKNAFFRPPYGRIKQKQARKIEDLGYKIVMWDIISKDYDATVPSEECYRNVMGNAQPGSIIVFHDSIKAKKNLTEVLPRILESFSRENYSFKAL